jgi:lactoylglutathione lyase
LCPRRYKDVYSHVFVRTELFRKRIGAVLDIVPSLGVINTPKVLMHSQSGATRKLVEFDHSTVLVRDLQKSAEFYEKVFGLERISEPFKDGKHIWFRIGAHEQLHVVGGATDPVPQAIDVHFAFRVASLPEFMAHLDQMHVQYRNFMGEGKVTLRPDGVRQIYVQDPDGYWIEVNDGRF